tara:strand:- start:1007 stop:1711 length:705 start_codon:yes stop_codon:yes gene_type:complete
MKKLVSIFVIIICFISKSEGSTLEKLYLESRLINNFENELYDNPDDFIIGNREGSITIVEFFDYNCGYCKRALADLNAVIAKNPNIRVVLKDYPILNENSYELSQLSIAAGLQGKYFEYHTELLNKPGRVTYQMAIDIAADIGLDIEKLEQDFKSQEVNDMIANNKVLGYSLAVSGTPSYFIRDVNIRGAVGLETLQEVIDYASENQRIDDYIIKEAESGNEEAYKVMFRYGLY